jgi:hypothetical protein
VDAARYRYRTLMSMSACGIRGPNGILRRSTFSLMPKNYNLGFGSRPRH